MFRYRRESVDDALRLCLDQFVELSSMEETPDSKRMMDESLNGLMNHLREMMVGYENEEKLALLKEMEGMVEWKALRISKPVSRCRWLSCATLVQGADNDEWLRHVIMKCLLLCYIRYNSTILGKLVFRVCSLQSLNPYPSEREMMLLKRPSACVVGFDDEVEILLDQLTGTSIKQLQIISITGMAGLGKTTLARTLYNHELAKYMFDFRAWTCVSREYIKKDLLLGILTSFIDAPTDDLHEMSEHQLEEELYRKLKGRKYMVVFDDIWDRTVWDDLRMCFPDGNTGSRVIFTSRNIDVSVHIKSARPAHVLRLRTEVESWKIFQTQVFRMGRCPRILEESGRVINRKCEGLPLAIVIAAGLLSDNHSVTWWEKVAESLRSFMVRDPKEYMDSFDLSYNHLPLHLKPCFLLFGAFPEDYEVPVTKLIWLWIAHGFIPETEGRMLEDVAGDFLEDLIRRSLLMIPKLKSGGQVKTCRIHDLLHDFCLRKAKEENFLSNNYRYSMISSMLCFPLELGNILQKGGPIHIDTYKFLKILDAESILISVFPLDATRMVNLRYLAIQARDGCPHASISNLVNLQMLIISSRKNILFPKTMWNMVNLRHLYIKSGVNIMEDPGNDGPSALDCFQTLSQVNPQSCHNIFSRIPNLKKLGFCGPLISSAGDLDFPNLSSLEHLEKLKLLNTFLYLEATRSCNPIIFPNNLKKLTLSNTGMNWEEIWSFSLLPNLEILKLKFQACVGDIWEAGDAEFGRLKILKLHDLDIKQWDCSRDNFPRLQRLVVQRCLKLESVPTALGNIYTLKVIEVNGCSRSAYTSAVEIQKEQESEGDNFLKVHGKQNY